MTGGGIADPEGEERGRRLAWARGHMMVIIVLLFLVNQYLHWYKLAYDEGAHCRVVSRLDCATSRPFGA